MAASIQPKSLPKEPPEPLLARAIRVLGVLVLLGTVPLALLPAGPKVIWSLVIAAVPLGFTVAGYYAWRRACPLAFFATLGRRLQVQRKRKVGDWLAVHGLEVQLGLLVAALAWRHLGANGTPWALAGLLLAVVAAATAVGFLYTGKTWCNHLCPVGVVEKFYQEPVLLLPAEDNSQCAACTACKKNCPDIALEQGCRSFHEFHQKAQADTTGKLRNRIVDAMTTNETYFFRDDNLWNYMREVAVPELLRKAATGPVRVGAAADRWAGAQSATR